MLTCGGKNLQRKLPVLLILVRVLLARLLHFASLAPGGGRRGGRGRALRMRLGLHGAAFPLGPQGNFQLGSVPSVLCSLLRLILSLRTLHTLRVDDEF
jgi:hypothetical protein